jgi:hypothetical protein
MILVVFVLRDLPRGEARVDIGVEIEALRVDEPHGADGGHEFRQRCRLIQRLGRGARAIGLRESDAVAVDQRDTDRGNIEGGHRLFERERLGLAVHRDSQITLKLTRLGALCRRAKDSCDNEADQGEATRLERNSAHG